MLLVFKLEDDLRMAIPLSLVARLEEFRRDQIEEAGGQSVVQYRGQIMPLINLAEMLGDRRAMARSRRVKKDVGGAESIQVVVYTYQNRNVGLRVERIVDVVEERLNLQTAGARPGVLGTAVIREKVVGLLDIDAVVRAATATPASNAFGAVQAA
jgi:two-component system chemotaxis sensor kinase CheA